MGTTYTISYLDSLNRNFQTSIDSLLFRINQEVSTYIDSATIVQFNRSDSSFTIKDAPHFIANIRKAKLLWQRSKGAFDPTVMPLVQYWGFGTEKRAVTEVDSQRVDSLKALIGFSKIELDEGPSAVLRKQHPAMQLDFSALAKGYGVDAIGTLLKQQGIRNFMVEIGGEVLANGKNARQAWWTIGINMPAEDAQVSDFQAVVELKDKGLATSGNYRNYYEVDGRKYGHTINPLTGFPEQTKLLSASVFANDCATADALATAFMVMGLENAMALANKLEGVEAYFIYGDEKGGISSLATPGLTGIIK